MQFKHWLYLLENTQKQYWGPFSHVQKDAQDNLIIKADELEKPLIIPKGSTFTYPEKYPVGKTLNPPWNKYFQYESTKDGNIVTYVENRAVDCICYSRKLDAIYLINRLGAPKGLALPGGFFDSVDGIDANNPPEPETIGAKAAARELHEETHAEVNPAALRFVGKFKTGDSDKREKNFSVWAYLYHVPEGTEKQFKFGDDAAQAEGSHSLGLKGWYTLDDVEKLSLAFSHHKDIISAAKAAL